MDNNALELELQQGLTSDHPCICLKRYAWAWASWWARRT